MLNKIKDIYLGLIFLLITTIIILSASMDADIKKYNTYTADFLNVDGVKQKSPIYMMGVKVGSVKNIKLHDGKARLILSVDNGVLIPVDSILQIQTQDFFAHKNLTISPGFEEENLQNGDSFYSVQNSVNFLGLLNDYLDKKIADKKGKQQ